MRKEICVIGGVLCDVFGSMYQMATFNSFHLMYAGLSVLIAVGFWLMASRFDKRKYGTFLGYMIIGMKVIDLCLQFFVEQYPPLEVIPLHMCNVALFLVGLALITKKKFLFDIVYCWIYAPLLVMFIPSSFGFSSLVYPEFFFLTHIMIVMAVVYMYRFYGYRIDKKGYQTALVAFILATANAWIWNTILGTNLFYINDYILPSLEVMGYPLYVVVFLSLHFLVMAGIFWVSNRLLKK